MLRVFVMSFVREFSWAQMNNSAHMHTVFQRGAVPVVWGTEAELGQTVN